MKAIDPSSLFVLLFRHYEKKRNSSPADLIPHIQLSRPCIERRAHLNSRAVDSRTKRACILIELVAKKANPVIPPKKSPLPLSLKE